MIGRLVKMAWPKRLCSNCGRVDISGLAYYFLVFLNGFRYTRDRRSLEVYRQRIKT